MNAYIFRKGQIWKTKEFIRDALAVKFYKIIAERHRAKTYEKLKYWMDKIAVFRI